MALPDSLLPVNDLRDRETIDHEQLFETTSRNFWLFLYSALLSLITGLPERSQRKKPSS